MWEFDNFPGALILREINFGLFEASKTAISTIWAAINFVFLEKFLTWNVKSAHKYKIKSCLNGQIGSLRGFKMKIWVAEISSDFHIENFWLVCPTQVCI